MPFGSRRRSLPQLNWAVVAPLTVALALLVGASGFIYGFFAPGSDIGSGVTAQRAPGTGGGVDLRPPELVKSKLFSLSARIVGTPTIRRGPGTQYAEVFKVNDGQEFHVVACSPGCSWLQVFSLTGEQEQWWLPSTFLAVSGNIDELPILTPVEKQ